MSRVELAKFKNPGIKLYKGFALMINGRFYYEGAGCQGLGMIVDSQFIVNFIRAFGADNLEGVAGKTVRVEHTDSKIHKISPLEGISDGKEFDIKKYRQENPSARVSQEFVKHIEEHLNEDQEVICKICDKTIDEIWRDSRC